jgi:outer membrane lipoprotein-sorting protein
LSAAVRRAVVATLLLVAPCAAGAQTLDEIVARHVEARGGREALAALRSVRMSGRAIGPNGREAVVRREIARPGRIRTEFVFQGTTGVYAWDGSVGWRVSPLDGDFEPEPLPDDEAAATAEQADLDGPLVDWKAKGGSLALVGTEALSGAETHHLRLTAKSGTVRDLWLDAKSGQLVRTLSTRKVRGRELSLEMLLGDYRATDGVYFPRSIEVGATGQPQRLRIFVDSVETNVSLDESRFRMPR